MTAELDGDSPLVIIPSVPPREEPKATFRKASDALYDAGYGGQDQSKIIAALGAAGLRIVEGEGK